MRKEKKKKSSVKLQKFEKAYTLIVSVAILGLWVVSFFTKISLSSINVEVERLSEEVTKQEKTNQSLVMKINELASLENIQTVASSEGLAYNNNNIVIVNNR